jgi:hypothetical protein
LTAWRLLPKIIYSRFPDDAIAIHPEVMLKLDLIDPYIASSVDLHILRTVGGYSAPAAGIGHPPPELNGGPIFKFNEAVSFQIECTAQEELDYYWERLSEAGDPQAQQCGWLKDKFGLSWQIVPKVLPELLNDPDAAKSQRAFQAMMQNEEARYRRAAARICRITAASGKPVTRGPHAAEPLSDAKLNATGRDFCQIWCD